MPLFRNRYRVESARMRGRDYTERGTYFITVCAAGRCPWFGEIQNGMMGLSDVGCVVADEWQRTPVIRSNVAIDAWAVMPDHVHCIVEIRSIGMDIGGAGGGAGGVVETHRRCVSTCITSCVPLPRRKPGSLGSIVNQWKTACTKRIRAMGHPDFGWQPRFHDRIIRSPDELARIRRYIWENPMTWERKRHARSAS